MIKDICLKTKQLFTFHLNNTENTCIWKAIWVYRSLYNIALLHNNIVEKDCFITSPDLKVQAPWFVTSNLVQTSPYLNNFTYMFHTCFSFFFHFFLKSWGVIKMVAARNWAVPVRDSHPCFPELVWAIFTGYFMASAVLAKAVNSCVYYMLTCFEGFITHFHIKTLIECIWLLLLL